MRVNGINFEEYLDFEIIKEPWCLYAPEDGAIIKFKLILVKVDPAPQANAKGYKINTANVVGVLTSKALQGTPSVLNNGKFKVEKKDIPFKTIEETWGEYKLEDGVNLKIKPAITSIDKAKDYDADGNPIYIVHSQVLIKT